MDQTNALSRRKFLKISGITGTVLALGYSSGVGLAPTVKRYEFEGLEAEGLNDFIFIDQSGKITLVNHRPEMGQGVYQAMPMLIAEELEVDMDDIQIVQSQADKKKYDHQQVGGSQSVRTSWEPSRKIGAAARIMLIQAAAAQWEIGPDQCFAKKGKVYNKMNAQSLAYGDLVEAAIRFDAPKNPPLKASKDFNILGKPLPRKDTPLKTNGTANFGLDMKIPGMVYASVDRSPVFLGKVKSFNKSEVMALPGIVDVIETEMPVFSHKRAGVAIIADNYYSALNARKTLKVDWDETGYEDLNQEKIFGALKKASTSDDGFVDESKGDFKGVYEKVNKKLESSYQLPYQSHACMEPMNCVVEVKDGKCEFWGPTQSPNWIRSSLAQNLDIKEENVTINVTFLGGGFGRRAFTDFPNEAAFISKAIGGKPVKVVWKREDDNTQGPFRPGTVHAMRAGFTKKELTSFQHKMATQAMGHQWPGADKTKKPNGMLEGSTTQYDIPNWETKVIPVEFPIPVMWWRSVYSSTNGFAHESFIDEIANELGKDPMQMRIDWLQKEPRFVKVLEKVRDKSGWNENRKNKGVAIVHSFGSICAHVVEVERQTNGKLKVKKVTSAIDCGQTVNSDIIKAQTEGNIVMALTAAIKSEITFEKGRAVEKNFDKYAMLRIHECPEIDVHIMQNEEAPGGVGEPGLPPLAPALGNAIFVESGKRVRKLPFNINEV